MLDRKITGNDLTRPQGYADPEATRLARSGVPV